ncbi:MAG TPA: SDR family NAD(P)-dependent oxidoreductase, partial [Pseudomonas sp.]|nr:SDR family NAD(P)-dependent oxidoreductase [Pseudomonas sp.]
MEKILIIGATSAIAEASARRFAAQGASLYLLARNQERLATLASDLSIRGASKVAYGDFDACAFDRHQPLLEGILAELGGLDTVLIAYGTLSDQKACESSVELTLQELNINALSVIALLTLLAPHFEAQREGCIAVIGSVAGDRG